MPPTVISRVFHHDIDASPLAYAAFAWPRSDAAIAPQLAIRMPISTMRNGAYHAVDARRRSWAKQEEDARAAGGSSSTF